MRVLVTGPNGFVGRAVCKTLSGTEHSVRETVRTREQAQHLSKESPGGVMGVGDIGPETKWDEAVEGIDAVVHLAARVHIMNDASSNSVDEYHRVNAEGTRRLAQTAAAAGVRRLIYLSTIKVSGEVTHTTPFTENDEPHPQDAYALSKFEAEEALRSIAQKTGLDVVILRPPLVYGPGVRANFLQLMKAIDSGVPLPLGGIRNIRGFIYLGNLVDALVTCIQHPAAANKTFLVSDAEDLSTPELIKRLASALGKPARLIPFPPSLLRFAGAITGRSAAVERLTGSLVVDSSKIRRELSWTPPFTVDEGLRQTAAWFRSHEKSV